jgi:hypothetical protein
MAGHAQWFAPCHLGPYQNASITGTILLSEPGLT